MTEERTNREYKEVLRYYKTNITYDTVAKLIENTHGFQYIIGIESERKCFPILVQDNLPWCSLY
jgi:hypothetical protein